MNEKQTLKMNVMNKNILHIIPAAALVLILSGSSYAQQGHQIVDIDENYYNIITIGTQTWMAENLKTVRYNDGYGISYPGTNNAAWQSNTDGAYAWYNNNATLYKSTYGALYNWYVVDAASNGNRNVCPIGWRTPTSDDFVTLAGLYGGSAEAGGAMKETGYTHWISPNTGATNASSFTGLPAGMRNTDGSYYGLGLRGSWWNNNAFRTVTNDSQYLYNNSNDLNPGQESTGISIRCIHAGGTLYTTPSLITLPVTSITPTTAISGGGKIVEGGTEIIARGVCWSTTSNRTIADPNIIYGT